ncbi:MAG: hypothetical protein ACTSPL_06920, partial [Candidatus Odinarchaeia archaeon]
MLYLYASFELETIFFTLSVILAVLIVLITTIMLLRYHVSNPSDSSRLILIGQFAFLTLGIFVIVRNFAPEAFSSIFISIYGISAIACAASYFILTTYFVMAKTRLKKYLIAYMFLVLLAMILKPLVMFRIVPFIIEDLYIHPFIAASLIGAAFNSFYTGFKINERTLRSHLIKLGSGFTLLLFIIIPIVLRLDQYIIRLITIIIVVPSFLLIYFGFNIGRDNLKKLLFFEPLVNPDPRIRRNRIVALFYNYTSNKWSCPFYDRSLKSRCRLDPGSYR